MHCKTSRPTSGKTLQKMYVVFPKHSKRIGPREKTLSKICVFHSINKLLKPLQLTAKTNQSNSIKLPMFFIVQSENNMLYMRRNNKKAAFPLENKISDISGQAMVVHWNCLVV